MFIYTLGKKLIKMSIDNAFFVICSIQNRRPLADLDNNLLYTHITLSPTHSLQSSSPSRTLSNLFWENLPWGSIQKNLKSISIFDTGCGSGGYYSILQHASNGKIQTYHGVDVYRHKNWDASNLPPQKTFSQFSGKNISMYIPSSTNFFMSQSAIEHFQNDSHYFQEIKKFIDQHPERPIIQVHLFPSPACMKLYGRHGYRQYTPRTISKLTRLFSQSQSFLFALGGPNCNQVHNEFITKPQFAEETDGRQTKPTEYLDALSQAINDDNALSSKTDPSFWALVICSNWKEPFLL